MSRLLGAMVALEAAHIRKMQLVVKHSDPSSWLPSCLDYNSLPEVK